MNIGSSTPLQQLTQLKECFSINDVRTLVAKQLRVDIEQAMANMDWDDYLRHEATMYRRLADKTENVFGKQELFELAAICEEVANSIEDRLTGG